jgi:hypothetical protein
MEELEATLCVEAELALETLRGAVDEYAGPIMDERTRTKLVRKRCVKPFDKRKADADDYIERVRAMVEPQRAEWRRKCECLVRFASRAARVRDARRHEAESIHADNFAKSRGKAFRSTKRRTIRRRRRSPSACEDIAIARG